MKRNDCLVDGCPDKPGSRGLCLTHYKKWWRVQRQDACAVIECKVGGATGGFCAGHAAERGSLLCVPHEKVDMRPQRPAGTWSCLETGCTNEVIKQGYRCRSCKKEGRNEPDHVPKTAIGPRDGWRRFRYAKGYVWMERTLDGKTERILEHRYVMQLHIGRALLPNESIHHLNGVRDDNRIENLEIWHKGQPAGQRVTDKVAWAKELLALYEPEALA